MDNIVKLTEDAEKIINQAKKGNVQNISQFKKVFKKNPPSTLSKEEVDTQVKGIDKFEKGEIDYATMRGMCG